METKVINYFVSTEFNEDIINDEEVIEISPAELKVLKLKNIKNINEKKCAKEMNLTTKEFKNIIFSVDNKITKALTEGISIIIKDEKEIDPEDIVKTICKFKCAVCGKIFTINYEKDEIICPLCLSSKVMTSNEAGFIKKQNKFKILLNKLKS